LDQQGYFDSLDGPKFNIANPWTPPATTWLNLKNVSISMLLCPSDGNSDPFLDYTYYASWGPTVPKSNYLGFFSGLSDGAAFTCSNQAQLAVFRYGKGTAFSDIKDGTSNTMAMAEYLKGVDRFDQRGSFHTNRAGDQTLFVTLGPNSTAPDNMIDYNRSFCVPYNNQPEMNLPCTVGGDSENYASPRSHHSGGVNAVFCDGSVRFVQDGIDTTAWRNLGWIEDGNMVSAEF
jgi:prepilin-type processing-associated H-X9-DG protein